MAQTADVIKESSWRRAFREREFLIFSIIVFVGKSALLIRLPYREVENNALYTAGLIAAFYCYFRFRYKLKPPPLIVFFLAAAVAVDVFGNFFLLYGNFRIGSVEYDEMSHLLGSGFSLPPAMWLLRATTRRFGIRLPLDLTAFLSVTTTFAFCAYYEILELWDEMFFDGKRLWTPQDSANDLQWDLAGIIIAALIATLVFKILDRIELAEAEG